MVSHFKLTERCAFTGTDRQDLCFRTIVNEIAVKIGPDGTNDDVTIKICSDADKSDCCTAKLSSTFKDDWSPNDLEKWSGSNLKDCKTKVFKVNNLNEYYFDFSYISLIFNL